MSTVHAQKPAQSNMYRSKQQGRHRLYPVFIKAWQRRCMSVSWSWPFGLIIAQPAPASDLSRGKESCLHAQLPLTRWRRCAFAHENRRGLFGFLTSEMMSRHRMHPLYPPPPCRATDLGAMWGSSADMSAKNVGVGSRAGFEHTVPPSLRRCG